MAQLYDRLRELRVMLVHRAATGLSDLGMIESVEKAVADVEAVMREEGT